MSIAISYRPLTATSLRHSTRLVAMIETARQRRALARLDSARLADMGLTLAQARKEAARPFWDISSKCA